jgi:DNA repair protein RadD
MSSVRSDILDVLRGRGSLSKEDVLGIWRLSEEQYADLKRELLELPDVESGPRKVGGFRIRNRKTALPPDSDTQAGSIPGAAWEARAVARLCELFQHRDLEELLGDLVYTVRLARKTATGEDRRGTKEELAHGLIIEHGIDLFRDGAVRAAVARKTGLKDLGRWHPGKTSATNFVKHADFPPELAGIPSEDPPDDFEYLEGRFDLLPLQDFQEEVKLQVLATLNTSRGRAIVTLPTGAGKTRVAVESIKEWLTQRYSTQDGRASSVLWLAHSGELCEQAYAEFRQVWLGSASVCPLLLFRFWARFTHDFSAHREALENILSRPSVLVSTPHRIVNLLEDTNAEAKEVLQRLLGTICLVVVDEAHRAAAPSYTRIVDALASSASSTPLFGLTATPFRTEYLADGEAGTRELASLFGTLIEARRSLGDNPRETLQARGILARPLVQTVKTSTLLESPPVPDPDSITEADIKAIDHALNLRADNPQRRLAVFQHVLPLCRDQSNSILYFGPSILDAECMAFLLRGEGIPAAVVSGETRDITRRRLVSDFKSSKLRVLCNCEVLTTGFDAPRVTHIIMARPTVSRVLYEQMVGRGLRGPIFGGTEECTIVDCEDNYRSERPTLGYQAFRHLWMPAASR